MKRLALPLSLTLLIFCTLAFSPRDIKEKSLAELLTYVKVNFDKMWQSTDFDYNSAHTFLEDAGVRGKYFVVKGVMGLPVIERLVGEPAFLSGPHQGTVDFSSSSSFGYYNPAFLKKLHDMLESTLEKQGFVYMFQPFYDAQLKRYLQTFFLSYDIGTQTSESIRQEYLNKVKAGNYEAGWYLQNSYDEFSSSLSSQSYKRNVGIPNINMSDRYDWAEASTCPGFWLRRSIDGTADEFRSLLLLMLKTFDPEFLRQHTPEELPARWLIVLKSSKTEEEATLAQASFLFKNEVIYSSRYENLSPGWFINCIPFNKEKEAKAIAAKIKKFGLDNYVKFSGKHK